MVTLVDPRDHCTVAEETVILRDSSGLERDSLGVNVPRSKVRNAPWLAKAERWYLFL